MALPEPLWGAPARPALRGPVPGQVAPGPALQQDDLAAQRAEAPADEEAAEAALQGEGRQVQDALPHALQQLVQVLLEEQLWTAAGVRGLPEVAEEDQPGWAQGGLRARGGGGAATGSWAWAFLIPSGTAQKPLNLRLPGTGRGTGLTLLTPTRYILGRTVHRRLNTDTHMSPLAGRLCLRATRQRYLQFPRDNTLYCHLLETFVIA